MQEYTRDQIEGREVYTSDGEKVGRVEEIFYDGSSNVVEWLGLKAGFLGMKHRVVPVHGASMAGDSLMLGCTKQQLEAAPDVDESTLEDETSERGLYSHYGVDHLGHRSFGRETWGRDGRGYDADGGSVVRHEEQLDVGTETVESGTARLRKWVDTKTVSEDVQVRRETAEIRREPINEPARAGAIGEEEVEVALTEERPVAEKRTVAKERVSLDKAVDVDTQRVEADLRQEQVAIDGAGRR